jgi:hypothetical protein
MAIVLRRVLTLVGLTILLIDFAEIAQTSDRDFDILPRERPEDHDRK